MRSSRNAGAHLAVEDPEQGGFLRMVGARGIAGRRTNTPVFFLDKLLITSMFIGHEAPELAAHPTMQTLGEGFGQPVGTGWSRSR